MGDSRGWLPGGADTWQHVILKENWVKMVIGKKIKKTPVTHSTFNW